MNREEARYYLQSSGFSEEQIDTIEKAFTSTDAISRQAVLDAIDVKAWEFCDYLISKNRNDEQKPVSHFADTLRECVREELPSVNPQPCEDAISRQAVQDYVAKYLSQYLYNDVREAVEVIDEYIGELPPVTPQPKIGHWISHHHGCEYECSECHDKQRAKSNYCPNCGARMVEPQERSDKE